MINFPFFTLNLWKYWFYPSSTFFLNPFCCDFRSWVLCPSIFSYVVSLSRVVMTVTPRPYTWMFARNIRELSISTLWRYWGFGVWPFLMRVPKIFWEITVVNPMWIIPNWFVNSWPILCITWLCSSGLRIFTKVFWMIVAIFNQMIRTITNITDLWTNIPKSPSISFSKISSILKEFSLRYCWIISSTSKRVWRYCLFWKLGLFYLRSFNRSF